ncbi:hypothetical protein GAPWKB11_0523 [Gilliamella apicola]|jgi:hypothetical protein|nr:hypothetical protein GAPWKB11_0523 [Gilliamella apicola]
MLFLVHIMKKFDVYDEIKLDTSQWYVKYKFIYKFNLMWIG